MIFGSASMNSCVQTVQNYGRNPVYSLPLLFTNYSPIQRRSPFFQLLSKILWQTSTNNELGFPHLILLYFTEIRASFILISTALIIITIIMYI